jgi:hypothetical protein
MQWDETIRICGGFFVCNDALDQGPQVNTESSPETGGRRSGALQGL